MPRTRECDFCGADIEPGTGTMLVLNDGTTHHFCSSKCEKNTEIGREARNLEWTEAGRRRRGRRQTEPEPEPVEEVEDAEEADAPEVDDAEPEADAEGDEADAVEPDAEDDQ